MVPLLTKKELEFYLYDFRKTLSHFDYSSIKNVTFLNIDAFLAYMENVKGNPFERQYEALQQKLDVLQPYLPFVSAQRANEFLEALGTASSNAETDAIKRLYTKKLREDFISFSRTATTDTQWAQILNTCEEIRLRKEEMILAPH